LMDSGQAPTVGAMEPSAMLATQAGRTSGGLLDLHGGILWYLAATVVVIVALAVAYFRFNAHQYSNGDIEVALLAKRYKKHYTIWWATMPTVVTMITFGSLCSHECVALPWLTLMYAPIVTLVLGVGMAIALRSQVSEFPYEEQSAVRRRVAWSALWGPALGYGGFGAVIMAIQILMVLFWSAKAAFGA
jgi:hypothetical protein